VEFLDGAPPPPPERRYWRAAVLWRGDGLNWTAARSSPAVFHCPMTPHVPKSASALCCNHTARVGCSPSIGRTAISPVSRPISKTGEFFQAQQPILQAAVYQVTSTLDADRAVMNGSEQEVALRLPAHIPPRADALVREWRGTYRDDRAFVEHALSWIATEDFNYTLEPSDFSGEQGFDAFLFDRRAGFCEHYAAAFATLMRLGGVPSRVVIGYFGGEFNDVGNHFIVRQSDAHCWCEVWLAGQGWMRVDPTAVIAPERVSAGLQSLIQSRTTQNADAQSATDAQQQGWRHPWRRARLMWDNINFQWDLRVLNYDEEDQGRVLAWFRLGKLSPAN